MNFRDAEALSAYLDAQLSLPEAARLEARLAVDADFRTLLDELRVARGLLHQVRHRRAPRNFTLHPANPRLRAPRPRSVPVLRFAGALASLLFFAAVAANGLSPLAARSLAAAPAPAFDVGGGMGGGPAATESPLEALAAAPTTGTPRPEATLAPHDLAMPTMDALAQSQTVPSSKQAPPEAEAGVQARASQRALIPLAWIVALAVAALAFGGLAWYLDRYTRRSFRSKCLEK
jgi:anti-sigma factor RsiW